MSTLTKHDLETIAGYIKRIKELEARVKVTPDEIRKMKNNLFITAELNEFIQGQPQESLIVAMQTMNATFEYVARQMEEKDEK